MSRRINRTSSVPTNKAKHYNRVAKSRTSLSNQPSRKRSSGGQHNEQLPFAPPEDWHEPQENVPDYRVIVQKPGAGYRHIVTEADVRERLSQLPSHFLNDLQVVQLSRMTRCT